MPNKFKVMCPSEVHKGYKKFLFAIEFDNGHVKTLWQCCGNRDCRAWYRVDCGSNGVKLTRMPKNYHFEFERLPILTDDYAQEPINA
jgi:hypothetical protein